MSRAAATDQLIQHSHHIFITETTQLDGKKTLMTSAHSLSHQSVRVNHTRTGKRWEGKEYVSGNCSSSGELSLLMGWCLQNNNVLDEDQSPLMRLVTRILAYRRLPYNVWGEILGFIFTRFERNPLNSREPSPILMLNSAPGSVDGYVVALRRPTLFPKITMDPFLIVDAAMCGQEELVLNILQADPTCLLKKATVKNSVGVEYRVTPLQAAVMANDVQMMEKMKEHFARLSANLDGSVIDGLAEMQRQILQVYKKSLQQYIEQQQKEIYRLTALNSDGKFNDALSQEKLLYKNWFRALHSDDITTIFEAHNKSQECNVFDFQPYVDAICNASQAELDDVMALIDATTPAETDAAIAKGVSPVEIGFTKDGKAYTREEVQALPFSELTLIQKLNRFRERLKAHMQQEIIFDPRHILTAHKHIKKTCFEVGVSRIADPEYKKRKAIFSQLVGWAQRNAAEPVKQDIRQGTWYLTEENERRSRPSRFNDYDPRCEVILRNSFVDVTLIDSAAVDGIGYRCWIPLREIRPWQFLLDELTIFKTYVSSKNSKLSGLMQQCQSNHGRHQGVITKCK